MIVPLSVYLFYAKNNSQSTLKTHLTETSTFIIFHINFFSDLLRQEGRGGGEEECLRDRGLRRGRPDGGHADRRGGGQEEVQQIPPTSGEEV